jgi:hypothetical protein
LFSTRLVAAWPLPAHAGAVDFATWSRFSCRLPGLSHHARLAQYDLLYDFVTDASWQALGDHMRRG